MNADNASTVVKGLLPSQRLTLKGPKTRAERKPSVYLGDVVKKSGLPAETSQDSALERALQRLKEAIGLADGGLQDHGGRS